MTVPIQLQPYLQLMQGFDLQLFSCLRNQITTPCVAIQYGSSPPCHCKSFRLRPQHPLSNIYNLFIYLRTIHFSRLHRNLVMK